MPLFHNNRLLTLENLTWAATENQEITGNGNNTTVQIFSNAGCVDTIPANFLQNGDTVIYTACWEVVQKDTATNIIPNLYWGGAVGGVALFRTTSVVASVTGKIIRGIAWVNVRTAGASPLWNRDSIFFDSGNNTFQDQSAFAFDLTTIPTNAAIVVQPTAQLTGTVTANDKVKLRALARHIIRG